MARHLCFSEPTNLVVDNWDACLTESETSWFRRNQVGGNNSGDALKEFLNVLMRVLLEGYKNPEQTKLDCISALQALITDDFQYNGEPHPPHLICHHLLQLFDTFPSMDVAVNMFRDGTTQTGIFLILVSGRMDGAWLNKPASNRYEHLAITLHVQAQADGSKVQKASFRSEFLSPQCYQAIRALDLVFTAFSLHNEKKNEVEAPIKMVAILDRRDEPKRFEEELKEAEKDYNKENTVIRRNHNKGVADNLPLDMTLTKKNINNLKQAKEELETNIIQTKSNFEELIQLLQKESHSLGEEERIIFLQSKFPPTSQSGGSSYWKKAKEANNMITEEEVLRVMSGGNGVTIPVPTVVEPISPLPVQTAGNGYYAAVEQVPIAGQPVYSGYSTCCPPYFTTDGTDYDVNGYPQRGGSAKHPSPALATYFQHAVKSMSRIVDPNKDGVHHLVSQNVTHAMRSLKSSMKSSSRHRLLSQDGGSVLGSLGTIIFPQGTVSTVTPLLLILGAKLTQKMTQDIKNEKQSISKKPSKGKQNKKKYIPHPKTRDIPKQSKTSRPMSNAQIRRLMRKKRQTGGYASTDCAMHLCGDASLRPFGDCLPPTWGPKCF